MIKPILFNTQMVAAIVDGKKTVTRRIAKELCDDEIVKVIPPDGTPSKHGINVYRGILPDRGDGNTYCVVAAPPFAVGDILYVRETFARGRIEMTDEPDGYPGQYYISQRLGENDIIFKEAAIRYDFGMDDVVWVPSIHMPKWAARIFLRVTDVRLERLQDISEDDVCAEGAELLIVCKRQYRVYDHDGVSGDMCWNTDSACKDCPERSSYGELFGEMVWNETIKKSDMDKYGWSANPWVWVIEFERTEEPDGWRDLAPTNGEPSDVLATPDWLLNSEMG